MSVPIIPSIGPDLGAGALRVHGQDVSAAAVGARPDPPALPHRQQLDGPDSADGLPRGPLDQARRAEAHPGPQEGLPSGGGDETDVLTVGLGGRAQPQACGLGADLSLGHLPDRQH